MSRVVQVPDELPAGYEQVRVGTRTLLLLPPKEAAAFREELRRREDEEEDRRRQELHQRQMEQVEKANVERETKDKKSPGQAFDAEPQPGWHRVLPGLKALMDDGGASMKHSADKDVNDRLDRLLTTLIERGPDRRVATPPLGWRDELEALEATVPNFRAPIRVLRNALVLAEATGRPARIPPMLLLGPPGVGKTYFSHRVAELLGAPHASLSFDQPSAGAQLRGSDKYWSNSEPGLLFNQICLGEVANPVFLLDELDKSVSGSRNSDPLAQLHGALEPETARRIRDVSVDIEFDASLVTYIATANTVYGIGLPILSRMEVLSIELPGRDESVDIARAITTQLLQRLGLVDELAFERRSLYVLAHLSPRLMTRAAEQTVAAAIAAGKKQVGEADVWAALDWQDHGPKLH